ncbi:MAG: serine hydroxymethyltransferase [Acidobacteria bacterium]|jgi:glycine hydroxymethyltransferase|nr:serine hydroxymethyltransferase [Acidobacteriota bacterium]
MPVDTKDVFAIVEKQNEWRGTQCVNLIASENTPSPAVRSIQLNDFMGRYAEGHPNAAGKINRYYQGTRFIDEIETMAAGEMRELFGCAQAEVRPYSGNNANTAIAMAWLRGGDAVIANSTDAGGHISHNFFGIMGRRIQTRGQVLKPGKENSVRLSFFPLTADRYHIDVPKSLELIEKTKPNLLVMGKSLYLFPDPVKELVPLCRELEIPILYDGAHVLGLIAGGQFQDPLAEGATWLTGSTHKTFPGPQRGVILANLDAEGEKKYWPAADRGVFPGTSSNHHLYSLPALLVATREMKAHGKAYAAQICRNAVALAKALEACGIPVEAKEFGYTRSHQIAVNVSAFGGGVKAALALEANDVICNYNMLPGDTDAQNPSGLRIGTPEMTRFGMKEKDFAELGGLMAEAIKGQAVRDQVHRLRARFLEMQYL